MGVNSGYLQMLIVCYIARLFLNVISFIHLKNKSIQPMNENILCNRIWRMRKNKFASTTMNANATGIQIFLVNLSLFYNTKTILVF